MVGLQRESWSFRDLDGVERALGGFFPALRYGGVDRASIHVRMDVATAATVTAPSEASRSARAPSSRSRRRQAPGGSPTSWTNA